MKKLELDLNKLSDEEIEMYLALKKKAGVGTQVIEKPQAKIVDAPREKTRTRTKTRATKQDWVEGVKSLEDYLKTEPRSILELFKHLGISRGGASYRTMRKYLKQVYKKRLMIVKIGKRVYYQVKDDGKSVQDVKIRTSKRKKRKQTEAVRWTDDMRNDLLSLKEQGKTTKQIKDILGERYDIRFRTKQIEMQIYNLGKRGWKPEQSKPKPKKTKRQKSKRKANPYISFQGKYMRKVMDKHDFSSNDAMKYLSNVYKEHNKDVKKASDKVEWELSTGLIEEVKEIPVKPSVEFPKFKTLDDKMEKVLIDILKNAHGGKLKLDFNNTGKYIGLDYYHEWANFCREFLKHSEQISEYLGVENKFGLYGIGGELCIKHE